METNTIDNHYTISKLMGDVLTKEQIENLPKTEDRIRIAYAGNGIVIGYSIITGKHYKGKSNLIRIGKWLIIASDSPIKDNINLLVYHLENTAIKYISFGSKQSMIVSLMVDKEHGSYAEIAPETSKDTVK